MSMIDPSSGRTRKRYYILSPDLNYHPGDYTFINEDAALINGRSSGLHEHPMPGSTYPISVGVPPLREKPKLLVGDHSDELLDIYGFGTRFVSSRAKTFLLEIDADGFEFAECDTVNGNGDSIEPYWLMDALHVIHEFDEERSSFVRFTDRNPESSNPSNPAITVLNDIYWLPNLPDSYHAFYLTRYRINFIVDAMLVNSWKRSGLKGAVFTPLQPPTEEEFGFENEYEDYVTFLNHPYWIQKRRSS